MVTTYVNALRGRRTVWDSAYLPSILEFMSLRRNSCTASNYYYGYDYDYDYYWAPL